MDMAAHLEHRRRLAAHLNGAGLELGPGHTPFEVPTGATVHYVDRWAPDENRALFPELADATFPKPDVVANFDTDRLTPIPSQSQDFVVCSHVLEHLAEPIGFIDEIHRVLRLGGLALILLPDRRQTFDRHQDPTPLAHLTAEHAASVTAVDDDHVRTFLTRSGEGAMFLDRPDLDWHRSRSIHVHYWTENEFLPVLLYGMKHLGQRWTLIDRLHCEGDNVEFGFVLQRSGSRSRRRTIRRFTATWDRL